MTARLLLVLVVGFIPAISAAVSFPAVSEQTDTAHPNLDHTTPAYNDGQHNIRLNEEATNSSKEERSGSLTLSQIRDAAETLGVHTYQVIDGMNHIRPHLSSSKHDEQTLMWMAIGSEYFKRLGIEVPNRVLSATISGKFLAKMSDESLSAIALRKWAHFLQKYGINPNGAYWKIWWLNKFVYSMVSKKVMAQMAMGSEFLSMLKSSSLSMAELDIHDYPRLERASNHRGLDPSRVARWLHHLKKSSQYRSKSEEELLEIAIKQVIGDLLTKETYKHEI